MNSRNLFLIGSLVVAAALLSWWIVSDPTSTKGVARSALPGAAVGALAGDGTGPADLEAPLAATEPGNGRTIARQETVASEALETTPRSWPEAATVWLEARVVLPAGTPGDESVQVLALSFRRDYDKIYGAGGPVTELHGGASAWGIKGVLGAAKAGPGGEVRIGLPPDTAECWLVVSGSYVYSLDPARVTLAESHGPVELRPALGAHITGRLIAPPDRAQDAGPVMEQVTVELDWSTHAALELGTAGAMQLGLETKPNGEGHFEFRAVPVGKPQALSTVGSSLARTFRTDIRPMPGEQIVVEIDLLIGATVRGRIVDEQGDPVAKARVRALGQEFLGNPTDRLRQTESHADGRFELAGLTPGKVWLQVEHEDHQAVLSPPFELADREVREHGDLAMSQGQSISGTLRFPDGNPAQGATLSAQPDLSENIAGSMVDQRAFIGAGNDATADESGAFRIKGLGSGPWVVSAKLEVDGARGADPAGRWNVDQSMVRAPKEGLELVLEPPVTLSGIVLDGQQQPVTAFTLHAERAGSQWYMPPSETRTESFEAEDGRFHLDELRSGSWTLVAESPGYARSAEQALELPVADELTLVLLRPIRLAGSVVDPEGKPVAGAEVSEELEGTEAIEAMQGRGDWPVAQSDGQGKFSLEGLAPGTGSVIAKKDGFAPSEASSYELGEGEEDLNMLLTLRRGGAITGQVYAKDGEPASGCLVILQTPTLSERRFANAEADGTFVERGLIPGTWQVQAFPGIESLQTESGDSLDQAALLAVLKMGMVELADEGEEHIVLGAPPADPVRVHGSITLDKEPVGSSVISFFAGSGGGMQSMKIETLDTEGRYSVLLDEPGDYLVTIQTTGTPGRQNSIEYRRTVPKSESHQLDFELPLARVSGRVQGPDGKPLAQARVTLTVQGGLVFGTVFGGQYNETATNADGEYELNCLRPGSYAIAAGGSPLGGALGGGAGLGRVVQTIEIDEGESIRGLNFRLDSPGRVHGTVRDTAGKPVAGASIFLRDESGNLIELFSLAQTNASGAFEYPGLAPGEYKVSARSKTHATSVGAPVRVRSGEGSEVTVVVEPGTMLLVTLVDKSGADIRSRVSVLDSDERDLNGMLGLTEIMERYSGGLDNTVQRIGPLPPGSYRVSAVAEDGRTTVRPVTLSGQPERKLKLRLK